MSTRITVSICISKQELLVEQEGRCIMQCPISSGKAGLGFLEGSGQTPTGAFSIYSKHGENAPLQCTFIGRLPQGIWGGDSPAKAREGILTRILTLEGLDAANANTRARYIYIHGTNEVDKLGSPASMGCIRVAPQEMEQLYQLCALGTMVSIRA